jgi:hypothetical protein
MERYLARRGLEGHHDHGGLTLGNAPQRRILAAERYDRTATP